jgi:diguanylate cyclase (GGDEF)-like protein/PAS domain S-box-containing protein
MNGDNKMEMGLKVVSENNLLSSAIGDLRHFHLAGNENWSPTTATARTEPEPDGRCQPTSPGAGHKKPRKTISPGQAALFAAVVDSAHDAIIAMSTAGVIVGWNAGAEQLYGYSAEEAIGRSFCFLVPLNRLDEFLDFLDRAHKGEPVSPSETVHIRKGGGRASVFLSVSPIRNADGLIAGVSAICREIHEPSVPEQELRRANEALAEAVRNLQQRNAQMHLVQEMSESLESCCHLDEAHSVLKRFLPKLFPACSGALFEWKAELDLLEASAGWGEKALQETAFSSEECRAMRRGQPHEVVGANSPVRCPHLMRLTQANAICAPLNGSGETLGVLCVRGSPYELSQPRQSQVRLSESRKRVVETIAGHIALTLTNLRLRERLRAQSIRDPVTGLFNRRYLDETLARELHRAARGRKSLSIILCDIDCFKQFNDTNGHIAGDTLLRSFGELVGKTVRAGDIACRYGGDEFVLLLLDTPLDTAKRRAELLQREFERLVVPIGEKSLRAGTLSIGVSVHPEHGLTPSTLLQAADEVLYRNKSRNGIQGVSGQV